MALDIFLPFRGRTGQNHKSKSLFIDEFIIFKECGGIDPNRKQLLGNLYVRADFLFTGEYAGDIDNLLKSLFDSLQISGVIKNDRQIKKINIEIKEYSFIEGISLKIENI